ncbi:hypothetical protein ACWDTG_00855 [Rhodococcus zopfii]|uniref:hypothetical protein n=1 Tax=Rhodococcus zopfii TaxID=43772 RepID=UPI0011115718|nr:hypothetical protein [Rhodococcus zopfii]
MFGRPDSALPDRVGESSTFAAGMIATSSGSGGPMAGIARLRVPARFARCALTARCRASPQRDLQARSHDSAHLPAL